ncbi:MAG: hypothetical protein KatS3mg077_2579 [Candidatus Binatia bacterium]|nr:MAG: hypothetical protein KatS3mg077_2579 [Candidatus Binatia bacterium]
MREGDNTAKRDPLVFEPGLLRQLDRLRCIVPRPTALRDGMVRARGLPATHGFEVDGFRPYTPGEDWRRVDWNALARTNEWLVRTFRAERESATYLLVDTSASMAVAYGARDVFDFARQLAWALAYVSLRRHEPVGFALLAGTGPYCRRSPLWRQRAQGLDAQRFLLAARAQGRVDLISSCADFLAGPLLPGVAFVLSDFYCPVEHALRALALLAARRLQVVAVHLLPQSHRDLDWRPGWITARDAETGEERTLAWNEATRFAYRAAILRHQETLQDACRERGFVYALVDPEAGLEAALFEALVQAGVLG